MHWMKQNKISIRKLLPFYVVSNQHAGRSDQLSEIHASLLNAQSEMEDATANLRQFMDRQSFDPERMEELNTRT